NKVFLIATFVLGVALIAKGQEPTATSATPLSQLLAEAEANNPQISAGSHAALAAKQMAPQVTTLPDPRFTYQQFSVGSPKPFAGYTNSDFAYIGEAAYRATLSAYASNREQFIHVLSYFTDVLNLRLEYAQTLVDHETA